MNRVTFYKCLVVALSFVGTWNKDARASVHSCYFGDSEASSYGAIQLFSEANYGGYDVELCVDDSPSSGTTIDLSSYEFAAGVPVVGNIQSWTLSPGVGCDGAGMTGWFDYDYYIGVVRHDVYTQIDWQGGTYPENQSTTGTYVENAQTLVLKNNCIIE
jgi:hypothetical protein